MSVIRSSAPTADSQSLDEVSAHDDSGRLPLVVALPIMVLASAGLWVLIYKAVCSVASLLG